MEGRTKVMISFFILVLLVTGMYFFTDWFSRTLGYFTGDNQKVRLAQCLDEKNSILYTTENCPYCQEQKEIFGKALEYVKVIDCDSNSYICKDLTGVPAWQIEGKTYYGVKSVEDLGKISGCVL